MSARDGGQGGGALDILIVDDSAVVREVFSTLFKAERGVQVRTAGDPIIAGNKIRQRRPDVIVLDINMPRMDGISFLRKLMEEDPIPVVVCSAHIGSSRHYAIRALQEGAVAIVAKPNIGVRGFLEESQAEFIDIVRGAAAARLPKRLKRVTVASPAAAAAAATATQPGSLAPAAPQGVRPAIPRAAPGRRRNIVAIGASTGGTEAIREILTSLSPDCPGVLVVQHMPEGFTAAFAEHLDKICPVRVKEAARGDRVLPGHVLIAPGNAHLLLRRRGNEYYADLDTGPPVSRHRPSVDVLFHSVAQTAGSDAVGVILTGMGNDGSAGMLAMRQAGARTMAQDEASSVVFGMPKEAIAKGAVDRVLSLAYMGIEIMREVGSS